MAFSLRREIFFGRVRFVKSVFPNLFLRTLNCSAIFKAFAAPTTLLNFFRLALQNSLFNFFFAQSYLEERRNTLNLYCSFALIVVSWLHHLGLLYVDLGAGPESRSSQLSGLDSFV